MTDIRDTETGGITGTADKDYKIIWFTEQCLNNVLRLAPTSRVPNEPPITISPSSSARPRP